MRRLLVILFGPILALVLLGPAAAFLVQSLEPLPGASGAGGGVGGVGRGGWFGKGGATLLATESRGLGVLIALAIAGLAAFAAFVAKKTGGPGLFAAGIVVAWASLASATVERVVVGTRDASVVPWLIAEGLLASFLCGLIAWAAGERLLGKGVPVLPAVRAAFFGMIVAVGGSFVLAVEPLKGQAFAAAILGGVLAGAAGGLASPGGTRAHAGGVGGASAAGATLAGALAAGLLLFATDPVAGLMSREVGRTTFVAPLDWWAGALLGVPLGRAWVRSISGAIAPVEAEPATEPVTELGTEPEQGSGPGTAGESGAPRDPGRP